MLDIKKELNDEIYESIYVVGIDDGLHDSNIYYPCEDLSVKVGSKVYIDNSDRSYEVLDAQFILPDENSLLLNLEGRAQKSRKGNVSVKDTIKICNPNRSEDVIEKVIDTQSEPLVLEFDRKDEEEMRMYEKIHKMHKQDAAFLVLLFITLAVGFYLISYLVIVLGYYSSIMLGIIPILMYLGHKISLNQLKVLEIRYILYNVEAINGTVKSYDENKKTIVFEVDKKEYAISLKRKGKKANKEIGVRTRFASTYIGSFKMKYTKNNDFEKYSYIKVKWMKALHMISFAIALIGLVITFVAIPIIFLTNIMQSFGYILMYIGVFVFSDLALFIIAKILDNYVSQFDFNYIIYSVNRDGGEILREDKNKGIIEYQLNGEKKIIYVVRCKENKSGFLGYKKV